MSLFFEVCFKCVLSPLCCLVGHSWRDFFFLMRNELVFVMVGSELSLLEAEVERQGSSDFSALTYEELIDKFTVKKDGFGFYQMHDSTPETCKFCESQLEKDTRDREKALNPKNSKSCTQFPTCLLISLTNSI